MGTSPFVSRTSVFFISFFLSLISAQSMPGATLLVGNGAPGAGKYQLVDDYDGSSTFFSKFNFYSGADPTDGHVQYVDQAVAELNQFVTTTSQGQAQISVDTTNQWPNGGPGRPSVRLISDNIYTHGLFILDLVHMPWGCGTWPAYWLLGPNWPSHGEIDIIEGVHTNPSNTVSLHTSDNCTISGSGQTAEFQTSNCYEAVNGNSGCGSYMNTTLTPNNYGDSLNSIGGGVYVTEWTSNYIQTWFFPRNNIPSSITNGAPDPSQFGEPAVNAQGQCPIDQHFGNMSIIINTDFCGDWAGNVYSQYTNCPQTANTNSWDSCVDFVGNNPSAFTDAYWSINSIKVYQMPLGVSPTSSYTTSLSSVSPLASTNTINQGMGAPTTTLSSRPYSGPLSSGSATSYAPGSSATPFLCPAYNGSSWTDYSGQQYLISCGLDYDAPVGNLNPVQQTFSFEACLEYCDTQNDCYAVAFAGGNGAGTCYPKSGAGTYKYDGQTNAGVRLAGSVSLASSSSSPASSSAAFSSIAQSSSMMMPSSTQLVSSASSSTSHSHSRTSSTLYSSTAESTTSLASSSSTTAAVPSISSFTGALTSVKTLSDTSTTRTRSHSWTDTAFGWSSFSWSHTRSHTTSASIAANASSTATGAAAAGSSAAGLQCPQSNGTSYYDSLGVEYIILCDLNTNPGAYSEHDEPDFISCVTACSAQTTFSCVGVTYLNSSKACFFKTEYTGTTASEGTDAAVLASLIEPPSSSSSAMMIATTFSMSSVAPSQPSASPLPTNACPRINNTVVTDANGQVYDIGCGVDTSRGSFNNTIFVGGNYTQCMTTCDQLQGCTAWTWSPYSYPGGVCFFKNLPATFVPGSGNLVAGILTRLPLSSSTVSSSPTSSSAGGVAATSSPYWHSSAVQSVPASSSRLANPGSPSSLPMVMTSSSVSSVEPPSINVLSQSQLQSVTSLSFRSSAAAASNSASLITNAASSANPPAGTTTPCATDTASVCINGSGSTVCSFGDNNYSVTCGVEYEGTVIDTSGINGLPSRAKRATEPTFQDCQTLCDDTTGCVALNYEGTNCTLLSSVTGTSYVPGAVGAGVTAPSNANPACPGTANQLITDAGGVTYSLACGTDYAGYNVGKALSASSFSVCAQYCDTNIACVGLEYIHGSSSCLLKSSFSGAQTPNSDVLVARRIETNPPPTSVASVNPTVTPSTTISISTLSGGTITITSSATTTPSPIHATPSGSSIGGSSYAGMPSQPAGISIPTKGGGGNGCGNVSLCYTCALTPTVVTDSGCGTTSRGSSPSSPARGSGSCPGGAMGAIGTTVLFTTHTITSCLADICPASGYAIGGMPGRGGATVVTTTDKHGHSVTYTQIPTGSSGGGHLGHGGYGGHGGKGGYGGGSGHGRHGGKPNPRLPRCPGSNNVHFTSPMGMIYQIMCDMVYTEKTLQTQTQSSLANCIAACDMYNTVSFMIASPCLGVSWESTEATNNCLLKTGTSGVYKRGIDSAKLLTPYSGTSGQGHGGHGGGSITGTVTSPPIVKTIISGGSTGITTYVSGGKTEVSTIVHGGSTVLSTYVTGGSTIISTYVGGGSTIVKTVAGGSGGHGGEGGGGGGGGSGGNGGNGHGGGGDGGNGGGGPGTGPGTGPGSGYEYLTTKVVLTSYSKYVSNRVTHTIGIPITEQTVERVPITRSVTTTLPGGTTTLQGTGPGTGPGTRAGTGPGTGAGTGSGNGPGTGITISYGELTEKFISTSERVYISNGQTYTTGIPVTELVELSVPYTKTLTTTTVSISVSISAAVSTVTGPTVTASGEYITVTEGPGQFITIYQNGPTVTYTPGSSASSFTCRTYATNYLNGLHGRMKRTDKRSIFDLDGRIVLGEMEKAPRPGAKPRL